MSKDGRNVMEWTLEKPLTPGWYFAMPSDELRLKHGLPRTEVIHVERHWDDAPLQFRYGRFDWFAEGLRAVYSDFMFAGPIPEPVQPSQEGEGGG